MFGGRYFAIRDRLRAVVAGIARLAGEQGVDASDLQDGGGASVHPTQPLRLVVAGDAIAGKSSLLNALFGRGMCPVGDLPTRGRPVWYGGAGGPKEGFACGDLPEGLQGDYEWIDSPGIKKWDDADRERLIEAAGKAEALLVVFHWMNPWESATWEFLAGLPEELQRRTLVVLQQTDRGETGDLPVVLQHLGELSRRRVGREFPVLPVSALRGSRAWSGGRPDPVAWRESGFEALEKRLDEMSLSPARLEGIDEWWRTAIRVVQRIEERIDRRARSVEDEAMFLGRIESMIEADRDERIGEISDSIDGLDLAAGHIREWMERRLGLVPSFFRCLMGDDTAVKLDGVVIESCEAIWQLQAETDAGEMREICRARWEDLAPKVRDWLGVKMDDFSEAGKILDEAGWKFVDGFVRATTSKARDIRPGAMLAEDLRFRQRTLVYWFAVMLSMLTAAGVLGALGKPQYALWALGASGAVAVMIAVFSWTSKRRILRAVDEGVSGALLGLGAQVRPERVDGVRAYFSEFSRSLDGLRLRVVKARNNLQPMMEQCGKLYLELRAFGHQFPAVSGIAEGGERQ